MTESLRKFDIFGSYELISIQILIYNCKLKLSIQERSIFDELKYKYTSEIELVVTYSYIVLLFEFAAHLYPQYPV